MAEGEPASSNDDALKTAEILYQQERMLLEDQLSYAESLRAGRHTRTTLLLVLIGIGLFKIEVLREAGSVLWLILAAIVCFIVGAYYLFTERPIGEFFKRKPQTHALAILHWRPGWLEGLHRMPPLTAMLIPMNPARAEPTAPAR